MFRFRNPIRAALPCLCAFLLMGVYALELLPRLNLTAVNLICLLLACLELSPGIVNAVNTQKAKCFSSSLLIAAAALAVNLRGQLSPFPVRVGSPLDRAGCGPGASIGMAVISTGGRI